MIGVEARGLYEALLEQEDGDSWEAVGLPWLARAQGGYQERLRTAAEYRKDSAPSVELQCELYALSRVGDLLLEAEAVGLFTGLGMTAFEGGPFDPFLHEIVEVEQAADPQAPVELIGTVWPGLMLGQLLIRRAGVRVRAGAAHAQRGVADRGMLYWTFRRAHRPVQDLSHGWGHNSQWSTRLRLDYRTPGGDLLNVAGRLSIDGDDMLAPDHPENLSDAARLLTAGERRELLRHRCLLRVPKAVDRLAEQVGWAAEFMPYDWRLPPAEEGRPG
ncbi:hypothetical protein ABT095_00585 [Kitasatospora sp. NPDC002227]|uniref:hypothetical protein n=1 Tax=Kitasatospora sp. NPDC002227 TaxID=3154773 RepID=UPI003328E0C4